jgi:hypothetical protein
MEKATEAAGAMFATDWNSTDISPTAFACNP